MTLKSLGDFTFGDAQPGQVGSGLPDQVGDLSNIDIMRRQNLLESFEKIG